MSRLPLNEDGLATLVDAFYTRVRADPELGPIFEDAVTNWPEHLQTLTAFWSSVMLGSGRYKGQPVPVHMQHRDRMTPELFDRWLALWGETTSTHMPADVAAVLQDKAANIARSLQLALSFYAKRAMPRHNTAP
ncbi:group III truncated hemoglobin [Acetobacter fabarum]|uniref:group III truncated hemoglobin n=1 Tax=Acetobacter fabarum TaxID=483199 RepID=UPI0039E7BFEE